MKKKFVITGLICLMLAQIGKILWEAFVFEKGYYWLLRPYNPIHPNHFIEWLIHAVAISLVVALAFTLRHRLVGSTFVAFVVAGALGAVIIPVFMGIVETAAFVEPTEANVWFALSVIKLFMSRGFMIAHVITALLAAMLGLVLRSHLTTHTPSGPNILNYVLTVVRRLMSPRRPHVLEASRI